MTVPIPRDTARGYAYALTAYSAWGLFALYFKLLDHLSPVLALAHRTLWVSALLLVLLIIRRRGGDVRAALAVGRRRWLLVAGGALIGLNWLLYLWAVANDHLLEASLGYFMVPLVSVIIGVAVLREDLSRGQWIAVAIAGLAVAIPVASRGEIPLVAIALALTWSVYSLVRKLTPIDPAVGLLIEATIVLPFGLAYLVWLSLNGGAPFGKSWRDATLLFMIAPVTILPLLAFSAATKLLPLSTLGLLNYLSPSLQFLVAVLVFGETFTTAHAITFALIWVSLAVFTLAGGAKA